MVSLSLSRVGGGEHFFGKHAHKLFSHRNSAAICYGVGKNGGCIDIGGPPFYMAIYDPYMSLAPTRQPQSLSISNRNGDGELRPTPPSPPLTSTTFTPNSFESLSLTHPVNPSPPTHLEPTGSSPPILAHLSNSVPIFWLHLEFLLNNLHWLWLLRLLFNKFTYWLLLWLVFSHYHRQLMAQWHLPSLESTSSISSSGFSLSSLFVAAISGGFDYNSTWRGSPPIVSSASFHASAALPSRSAFHPLVYGGDRRFPLAVLLPKHH
ncbi:unnamed protein product [Camellia sinensis]